MRMAAANVGLDGVRWPAPVSPWQDTGEGGLYAAVWWPHKDEWDRCCVGALADMHMADVMSDWSGPNKPEFTDWGTRYKDEAAWEAKYPDGPKFYESAEYARSFYGEAVGALLYLGSTPHALWNDEAGYFKVTAEALTAKGKALVEAAEALYGPATYLTFLDT